MAKQKVSYPWHHTPQSLPRGHIFSIIDPTSDADIMPSDDDISVSDGSSPPAIAPSRSSVSGESSSAPGVVLLASLASTDSISPNAASERTCDAETFYKNSGCCLKVLYAMCHGILVDDKPLIDMVQSPWVNIPTSQIRPNREMYAKEIERRCSNNQTKGPRPRQWNLAKIQEWLDQHPVDDAREITFLKVTVEERKQVAEKAGKEVADEKARLGAGNWNSTACMRLIHSLIDFDDIKRQFLNRMNLPPGRSSVENREQLRASNVWQKMADKWNDKSFSPETVTMPDVCTEFAFSDVILHDEVANLTPATAEKVEDKWSSMILEMNRCIANWQKSGQGEGGIDDADNAVDIEFGSLANRSQHALASRHEFFNGRSMYLLYLWVLLDRHGLLGSALQKLNLSVSATNGASGVPSVVRPSEGDDDSMTDNSAKTNENVSSLGKSIEQHGKSLLDVAKMEAKQKVTIAKMQAEEKAKERQHQLMMEMRSTLRHLAGEKRSLSIQYASESQKKNKVMADVIQDQIAEIEADMKRTSESLLALESTPKKHNRTPESAIEDDVN